MRIENIEDGFMEIIENGVIEKVVCKYDGICTVYFYDKPPKELNVGCSSYNSQYGIPVSVDGSKLFVGSWEKGLGGKEKGLLAYDIASGSLLWRLAEGKIRSIFVYSNYLIVLKAGASIMKLNIDSGVVLEQIKSSAIEHLFDLGFPYALVDAIAGKLSVVDVEEMLIVRKYGSQIVNPSNCLSVLIQDAALHGEALTIYGVEDYPDKNYQLSGPQKFERVIDKNFNAL
ncbi:MAG: PQQ-like beta-propeller repeat protein [Candidatus Methanofastidiosum sp.]|jgi:hypothetical protein|nr:PQQ-like beta-propeller repeat protein [Methanofastidiosum sp.]